MGTTIGEVPDVPAVKHDFSQTYDQPWPHAYFRAHLSLDYVIPDRARAAFEYIIDRLQARRRRPRLKIVDVGCSYGINAALLRSSLTLDELYAAYTLEDGTLAEPSSALHREFFRRLNLRADRDFVGLDPSTQAVRYALEAGLITDGIIRNLETEHLTDADRRRLEGADLIISTGCIGYATAATFRRVYEATSASRPWVAAYAMHPFGYEEIGQALEAFGLRSREVPHLRQRQRRFATPAERAAILSAMGQRGMDDRLERATGYIHASFHLSVPLNEDC